MMKSRKKMMEVKRQRPPMATPQEMAFWLAVLSMAFAPPEVDDPPDGKLAAALCHTMTVLMPVPK